MAAAQSFLVTQHTLRWKNHVYHHSPQFSAHTSKNLTVKCFFPNNKFGFPKIEINTKPAEISGGDEDGGWFKSLWSMLPSRPSKTVNSVNPDSNSVRVSVVSTGTVAVEKPPFEFTGAVGGGSRVYVTMTAVAVLVLVLGFVSRVFRRGTAITSVLKLQVGLLASARSLQMGINQLAETADISTSKGLHRLLTETVLAFLQHPEYCISTYTSTDLKKTKEEGEQRFYQLSIEERSKFDNDIFINVKNLRANGFSNEYKVMTILVAAGGAYKLRSINNRNDLKEALKKLVAIPSSRMLAVDVLWTPRFEDDTLSEREMLEEYPLLRPL
ncbi:hypothetical protein ABFS82_14G182200 [Erythranthe guttata]